MHEGGHRAANWSILAKVVIPNILLNWLLWMVMLIRLMKVNIVLHSMKICPAAFDTADHTCWICSFPLALMDSWFKSYLSVRVQAVVAAGSKSRYQIVDKGVPQGLMLDPLLFILYLNLFSNWAPQFMLTIPCCIASAAPQTRHPLDEVVSTWH